mmetsp:Transcript_4117/g.6374  ORF Transcript_4117/g.6374 Transcript_4117/m.6374 type:complete len:88 (+) Transcript_4117:97-360(+)
MQSEEEKRRQNQIMTMSIDRGLSAALTSFVSMGLLVYVAHMKHPGFRKNVGVSGKSALPIMAGIFMGSLVTELTMYDAKRNPENWGL